MKDWIRARIKITSLKEQLVLLFLMVSIIPLLWVSLMAYNNGKNLLKDSVGQSLSQLAIEKLEKADRSVLQQIEEIKSRTALLREKVRKANKTASGILEEHWKYGGEAIAGIENDVELLTAIAGEGGQVVITNKDGYVIGATDKNLAFDQSNEIWWKKAYSLGVGYDFVDDVQYNPERKLHYIPISVPIKETDAEGSEAIGVLRIVFALPELKEIVDTISNNEVSKGTEVIIIDDGGVVLAASPNSGYEIFKSKVSSLQGMEALTPERYGYYGYGTESDGTQVIGRARTQKWTAPEYKDRNFANWTVLVSQPAGTAFAVAKKLRNKILIFTLLSCLVIVPIAWVFARKIVTPILTLANAAKEMSKGEFDLEIPIVSSSHEVGILAEEFRLMQKNLKQAIRKLTQEEKKMIAVANSLSEGLIVVDESNHILHINRSAIDMLKVEDISEDMIISDIVRPPELMKAIEKSAAQISEENKIGSSEVTLEEGENETILKVLARPFVDENGQALGSVYVLYDITREREIDKMKTDFVRLVSHELRTPLTSIIGFVSVILDGKAGPINDIQRKSLTRVARQSKRLASLINNLLDISRIESGRIEMKQEVVSLLEIAKQRIEEIRPQADEKEIGLDLIAPDSLPMFVGDEERIGQVVTNLIGNAIKFTPNEGKVTVRIRGGGNLLHLEVIDTGPGIPEEKRQKVFDKFYQLDGVSTRKQGGSGLGLSIAKSIVESHGGRIWIDDGEGGKGSNFQFVLPAFSGQRS